MSSLATFFTCLAFFVAGLLGLTLSVPLQAPAVILFGFAALVTAVQLLRGQGLDRSQKAVDKGKAKGDRPHETKGSSKNYLLGLVVISIVYFVGRAWFSPVRDLGVEDLMLVLPAGIFYLVAGHGFTGRIGIQIRQGLACVVVGLLLLHLGSCFFQLNGGEGYSLPFYFTGSERAHHGQITGMYGYYGSFANFAVIAGLLCLSLGVWGRMAYGLRGCLFSLGMVALGLAVYSQSRSAVLAMTVALVVYGVLLGLSLSKQSDKVKKWGGGALLIFMLLGGGAGLAGGVWVFAERAGAADGADVVFASAARTQFWSMAVEQWADTPVMGGGARSFSYEGFRYWNPNMPTTAANPEFVHNEYLQLLADYGIVGFLCILSLLVMHLYCGGKQVKTLAEKAGQDGFAQGSNAVALAIAGVCGMTAMAVHIIFDFRTHLLANLLLLICCAVWVLPLAKPRSFKVLSLRGLGGWQDGSIRNGVLVVAMLILGFGAVSLGGQQLWAGVPLLENKMSKEDGAWVPEAVNREVWIPALEESLNRAPQWRRYQRLGTLYRLEANTIEGREKKKVVAKAEKSYLASIERHPFNPIPRINLAAIYTAKKEWQKASEMYASASEMAKAREAWFRMHIKWAKLHQVWGVRLWEEGDLKAAEDHLKESMDLYETGSQWWGGYIHKRNWLAGSIESNLWYARLLDQSKRFREAEQEYTELRKHRGWHGMLVETNGEFVISQHYYDYGYAMWMKRKPKEAHRLMEAAKEALEKQNRRDKKQKDLSRVAQMKKIQEVIGFLNETGEGNGE